MAANQGERTRRRLSTEERREQLLTVGARLFSEDPYDDVWIEQVAEIAGVSRGLLYHYFPTKRDFFAAVVERESERMLRMTAAVPGCPRVNSSPPPSTPTWSTCTPTRTATAPSIAPTRREIRPYGGSTSGRWPRRSGRSWPRWRPIRSSGRRWGAARHEARGARVAGVHHRRLSGVAARAGVEPGAGARSVRAGTVGRPLALNGRPRRTSCRLRGVVGARPDLR